MIYWFAPFELDLAKVELCAWAERGFKAGSTLFGRIGRRAHLELTLGWRQRAIREADARREIGGVDGNSGVIARRAFRPHQAAWR